MKIKSENLTEDIQGKIYKRSSKINVLLKECQNYVKNHSRRQDVASVSKKTKQKKKAGVKFKNGLAMYEYLQTNDLYNPELEIYLHAKRSVLEKKYPDTRPLYKCKLDIVSAQATAAVSEICNKPWNKIIDTKGKYLVSIKYCEKTYDQGTWINTTEYNHDHGLFVINYDTDQEYDAPELE